MPWTFNAFTGKLDFYAALGDGDKGDITVSSSGTVWTIDNGAVTEAKLSLSNITTANVSTSAHGLCPILPNNTTDFLRGDGTFAAPSGSTAQEDIIGFVVDGAGSAITTGSKGYREIPYGCTINSWTILGKESGSCVVDVKRCTYSGFPTTASIAGTEKPTLSSAQKNQDATLSTWTTSLAAGDILEFVVDSASTVTRITVSIKVTRT